LVTAIFIFSAVAALECCITITFPQKVIDLISRFEASDVNDEKIKQEPLVVKIFAFTDLLIRIVLPILLLLSQFQRFHIYAWIFIAEFFISDIILSKVAKKYYLTILLSATELCIFTDVIRSSFLALRHNGF
jgi:hypothetical protein